MYNIYIVVFVDRCVALQCVCVAFVLCCVRPVCPMFVFALFFVLVLTPFRQTHAEKVYVSGVCVFFRVPNIYIYTYIYGKSGGGVSAVRVCRCYK